MIESREIVGYLKALFLIFNRDDIIMYVDYISVYNFIQIYNGKLQSHKKK